MVVQTRKANIDKDINKNKEKKRVLVRTIAQSSVYFCLFFSQFRAVLRVVSRRTEKEKVKNDDEQQQTQIAAGSVCSSTSTVLRVFVEAKKKKIGREANKNKRTREREKKVHTSTIVLIVHSAAFKNDFFVSSVFFMRSAASHRPSRRYVNGDDGGGALGKVVQDGIERRSRVTLEPEPEYRVHHHVVSTCQPTRRHPATPPPDKRGKSGGSSLPTPTYV